MALACPKSAGTLAIRDDWPEVLGSHFQTVMSVRTPGRPSVEFAFVEGGACFWHMVDLLWIVLFPLLYLVK